MTSIEDDVFDGEFVPLGQSGPRLKASFLLSEVDSDDTELVRPGALFYIVSTHVRVSSRRWQPSSTMIFRRIPRPRSVDVSRALIEAADLRRTLGLNEVPLDAEA